MAGTLGKVATVSILQDIDIATQRDTLNGTGTVIQGTGGQVLRKALALAWHYRWYVVQSILWQGSTGATNSMYYFLA